MGQQSRRRRHHVRRRPRPRPKHGRPERTRTRDTRRTRAERDGGRDEHGGGAVRDHAPLHVVLLELRRREVYELLLRGHHELGRVGVHPRLEHEVGEGFTIDPP